MLKIILPLTAAIAAVGIVDRLAQDALPAGLRRRQWATTCLG